MWSLEYAVITEYHVTATYCKPHFADSAVTNYTHWATLLYMQLFLWMPVTVLYLYLAPSVLASVWILLFWMFYDAQLMSQSITSLKSCSLQFLQQHLAMDALGLLWTPMTCCRRCSDTPNTRGQCCHWKGWEVKRCLLGSEDEGHSQVWCLLANMCALTIVLLVCGFIKRLILLIF